MDEQPLPYGDIVDLRSAFEALNDYRMARALTWRDVRGLADEYDVSLQGIFGASNRVALLREAILGGIGKECDCHVPEGRRWHKADTGEPVTYSVNMAGAPAVDFDLLQAIRYTFANYWALETGIQFMPVSGRGDIHLSFTELDGLGGTLGQAYMPSVGDRMDVHPLIGDIFIDRMERWNLWFFITVLAHEIGHAIGINHTDLTGNILLAFYGGPVRLLGDTYDKPEGWLRYGRTPAALLA